MKYRNLGSTDMKVSEVSFGTWAIGGSWGKIDDETSLQALHYAIEEGVNFFDTADVYGGGHSEELLAKATMGREEAIHIATKFCRDGDIHDPDTYTEAKVREYCEDSLRRLQRDCIDLYQVHCPPLEIIKQGFVFEALDKLKQEGKIKNYGVSVETVEEGLYCLKNPNLSALQVIFNIFRQKPLEQLLPQAKKQGIGILVRLPLASGLLTGKFNNNTVFDKDDHRQFNRNGEQFNVGETFAGLKYELGVELSRKLQWIAEGRGKMSSAALRWILDHEEVSCVIPGFRNVDQVKDNLMSLEVPSFSELEMKKLEEFYNDEVKDHIRGVY